MEELFEDYPDLKPGFRTFLASWEAMKITLQPKDSRAEVV